MYLQHVIDHNPQLIKTAIEFHQEGLIPANTWIIDLDTIVENARALSKEANRLGLTTYLMSKQHNRNPYIRLSGKKEIKFIIYLTMQIQL